jgi:hypothetical protein
MQITKSRIKWLILAMVIDMMRWQYALDSNTFSASLIIFYKLNSIFHSISRIINSDFLNFRSSLKDSEWNILEVNSCVEWRCEGRNILFEYFVKTGFYSQF